MIKILNKYNYNNLDETILFKIFCIIGNFVLYKKGYILIDYNYVNNEYFPFFFNFLNPFFLNLALIFFILPNNRLFNFAAVFISGLLILHPNTIGVQHYVCLFWTILWLVQYDKSNEGKLFGKFICSFIFSGALIGKISPGWISGDYISSLDWIDNFVIRNVGTKYFAVVILLGELLVTLSFLITGRVGLLVPLFCIVNMLIFVSIDILDALGPVVGLYVSLLITYYPKYLSLLKKITKFIKNYIFEFQFKSSI